MRTRAIWIGPGVGRVRAGGVPSPVSGAVGGLLPVGRAAGPGRGDSGPAVIRVVPAGWSAHRLVEEPARPGQTLLTRSPSAHAADVALWPGVAGRGCRRRTMAPAHPKLPSGGLCPPRPGGCGGPTSATTSSGASGFAGGRGALLPVAGDTKLLNTPSPAPSARGATSTWYERNQGIEWRYGNWKVDKKWHPAGELPAGRLLPLLGSRL